jgi:hypothetical protein
MRDDNYCFSATYVIVRPDLLFLFISLALISIAWRPSSSFPASTSIACAIILTLHFLRANRNSPSGPAHRRASIGRVGPTLLKCISSRRNLASSSQAPAEAEHTHTHTQLATRVAWTWTWEGDAGQDSPVGARTAGGRGVSDSCQIDCTYCKSHAYCRGEGRGGGSHKRWQL